MPMPAIGSIRNQNFKYFNLFTNHRCEWNLNYYQEQFFFFIKSILISKFHQVKVDYNQVLIQRVINY